MSDSRTGVNGEVAIDPNEILGIERDTDPTQDGVSVLLWPGRWRIRGRSLAGTGPSGGGGSSTITADDTPAAPAEGESASYLVTSAVVWPAGLVWSTDPDRGTAPTITGTALVSMFTVGGTTRAVLGATFPGPDTTNPTPGSLAASAITSSGFTLTVTGATDETELHATPYAYSTDNGTTWSAWQAGATYNATGLTAETTYACQHKVRDAALNEAAGTAITTTTGAPPVANTYAWARRVTPEQTDPPTESPFSLAHTYTVAGTPGRLLVAGFSVDKNSNAITVSPGWNLVASSRSASVSGAIAWRVATGSDDITWTLGGGTTRPACCDVHEFTGFGSPTVDVFATTPPDEATKTSIAVTAGNATADGMAVAIAGQDTVSATAASAQTVDSGYTMRSWNTAGGGSGGSLLMATKDVSAGDSTAATFDFKSVDDQAFGAVAVFKG